MKNAKAILNKYKTAAKLYGLATQNGDYKNANRQVAILKEIYTIFQSNPELQKIILNQLIQDDNPIVSSWAAAHSLGLEFEINQAIKVLEEISKRNDVGIISFDAGMTLRVYGEKGCLKF